MIISKQNILADYFKFFTSKDGIDMLRYAYQGSHNYYEDLILNCKEYYLYSEEVEVIKSHQQIFRTQLDMVNTVIDVGPGTKRSMQNKTIPIIKQIASLDNYFPIDFCNNYLQASLECIRSEFPLSKLIPIEEDLLENSYSKVKNHIKLNDKKLLLFLGSTLGNFDLVQQKFLLKKFSDMLNIGDKFIISVDTNHEVCSLLSAYDHSFNAAFLKNTLLFFTTILPSFVPHINKFDTKCIFKKREIEMFLVAKESFTFNLPIYGKITISKGQKLRSIKSRKFNIAKLEKDLFNIGFNINEILGLDKIKILVCSKMK